MDAFEAIEIEGLVHLTEVDADRAFCGVYVAGGIKPDGDTNCCPECVQILQENIGIHFDEAQ